MECNLLSRQQLIHCTGKFPQVPDLEHIVAQRRILGHVAVAVPEGRGFRIQPDRARRPACHHRENVHARIVIVVAPVADDDQGCLAIERIQMFVVEIIERPAEVGVVVSAGHAPQNGGNRLVGVRAVEVLRNLLEMVDEREGVCLAHLPLQREQEAQHQLRAETHGGADIADHHDLWLASPVTVFDLHGHAMIFEI